MWIIVAKACDDCGGTIAVRAMSTEPTAADLAAMPVPPGCGRVRVTSVQVDGPVRVCEARDSEEWFDEEPKSVAHDGRY